MKAKFKIYHSYSLKTYFWTLLAPNGFTLAGSNRSFSSRRECTRNLERVKKYAFYAEVIDVD